MRKKQKSQTPMAPMAWQEWIVKGLPILMLIEAIYLPISIYTPFLKEDLSVTYGYIPFVHLLYSLLYLLSTIGILTYFSLSQMMPISNTLFGSFLSLILSLLTSFWLLSFWGIFLAYLLYKRRRIAWYLLVVGAIITIYDISTGIGVYSYIQLLISVIATILLLPIKRFYK